MEIVKLYILAEYRSLGRHYKKGGVIEVPENEATWLMADSPGSFSLEPPEEVKEVDKAPADKAVKAPAKKKTTRAPKKGS